ncbi:hypothetical protein F5Y19DRAFT_440943 [Xylariaceae sp. FL1651]|nr:hypothetical protein F5Y19DRAFT_440943 [Xylariaceae sp. FL1651]
MKRVNTLLAPFLISAGHSILRHLSLRLGQPMLKFPHEKDRILAIMGGGPAERVLTAIEEFPSIIRARAKGLSNNDDGPFPLCHADFFHSNIVVDDTFKVLGIIDWGGLCTLPLELVTFPDFLDAMPAQFDLPDKYDEDGQPKDDEQRERWSDREKYVQIVKPLESGDNVLSRYLVQAKNLALAYSMKAFKRGKLGFMMVLSMS